jgi:tRNA threonylcarbamoyladenosine biosynthesis protein TsaE
MEKIIVTNSNVETMNIGLRLSEVLLPGSVLLLTGDLGAGKTTLVRGLAKGLGIKEVVQSPTFNIMKVYLKAEKPLIHIDAYRLADINDDIGLDEYIGYESGITVIEWPDYIKNLIPDNAISISIKHKGNDVREITINSEEDLSL